MRAFVDNLALGLRGTPEEGLGVCALKEFWAPKGGAQDDKEGGFQTPKNECRKRRAMSWLAKQGSDVEMSDCRSFSECGTLWSQLGAQACFVLDKQRATTKS